MDGWRMTGWAVCVVWLVLAAVPLVSSSTVPPALQGRRWGTNIHFYDPRAGEMPQLAQAFRVARYDFVWAITEKQRGAYNFSHYETLLNSLQKHGVQPYWILDYGNPVWTKPGQAPTNQTQYNAFARWATAAMHHFKGNNVIWELYNEPNQPSPKDKEGNLRGWYPHANATQYTQLYKTLRKHVDGIAALGNETLVAPASAGFDWDFLEACFKQGLLEGLDGLSVHPYRRRWPETVIPDYQRLRALMRTYLPEGAAMPTVLSGEWGYSTCHLPSGLPYTCDRGAWTGNNSLNVQAKFLARQWLTNTMEDVPISIFYEYKNGGNNASYGEDNFGVVEHDYLNASLPHAPKPAYHAAVTLQQLFGDAPYIGRRGVLKPDGNLQPFAYALLFSTNNSTGANSKNHQRQGDEGHVNQRPLERAAPAGDNAGTSSSAGSGHRLAVWSINGTQQCVAQPRAGRQDCGYLHIGADECHARGCCFEDPYVGPGPQCFFKTVVNTTATVSVVTHAGGQCYERRSFLGERLGHVCAQQDGNLTLLVNDEPIYLIAI